MKAEINILQGGITCNKSCGTRNSVLNDRSIRFALLIKSNKNIIRYRKSKVCVGEDWQINKSKQLFCTIKNYLVFDRRSKDCFVVSFSIDVLVVFGLFVFVVLFLKPLSTNHRKKCFSFQFLSLVFIKYPAVKSICFQGLCFSLRLYGPFWSVNFKFEVFKSECWNWVDYFWQCSSLHFIKYSVVLKFCVTFDGLLCILVYCLQAKKNREKISRMKAEVCNIFKKLFSRYSWNCSNENDSAICFKHKACISKGKPLGFLRSLTHSRLFPQKCFLCKFQDIKNCPRTRS